MPKGLLWFDNDPKHTLAYKVGQAAARYQLRVQQTATVCYLHVDDLDSQTQEIDGIHLKPVTNIQRHHLLIGVE